MARPSRISHRGGRGQDFDRSAPGRLIHAAYDAVTRMHRLEEHALEGTLQSLAPTTAFESSFPSEEISPGPGVGEARVPELQELEHEIRHRSGTGSEQYVVSEMWINAHFRHYRTLPGANVSAGERVRQIGRLGDAPRRGLGRCGHTSAQSRVSAASCDQVRGTLFRTSAYPPRRLQDREPWMTTCAWYPS